MYEGNQPHVGGVFSWRKGLSRNWGVTASYMVTASADPERHFDHFAWVSAEHSFGRADRTVPYVLLGSAGFSYHALDGSDNPWLFALPGSAAASAAGAPTGPGSSPPRRSSA